MALKLKGLKARKKIAAFVLCRSIDTVFIAPDDADLVA
jgi:hypothetical protein